MDKELKNSYSADDESKISQVPDQWLASSYFNNTLGAIKSLGITSVQDAPHQKSDMANARFLNSLFDTKQWLEYKAFHYARKNHDFRNLETLLRDDPLSKDAGRFQWHGLFRPEDRDSEEYYQYTAFSVVWQNEKITKFRDLVEKYWEQQPQPKEPEEPARPSRTGKILFYLGKRAVDLALLGVVAAPVGYFIYQHYFKPDVRDEIKDSMPSIPTLDEMVDKFKPEIRKELSHYNDQSAENIERVIINVLNKYSEKNPLLKKVLPELTDELKKEFNQKSNPEEQNKEEDF